MHISAAAILAICVAASNALPTLPRVASRPKPGDVDYIPGCTGVSFPDVYPPTPAAQRCIDLYRAQAGKKDKNVKLPEPNPLWGGRDIQELMDKNGRPIVPKRKKAVQTE